MNHNCAFGRRISKRFTIFSAVFAGLFALVFGSVSTLAFVRLQNGVLGLYWANGTRSPIFYTISTAKPCPGVTDGSADAAIRMAFARWQAIPSTTISFQEDVNPRIGRAPTGSCRTSTSSGSTPTTARACSRRTRGSSP